MSKITKLARNEPCLVRIPGICNGDCETTVLAHINRGGVGGMGTKAPDRCGVFACSACHDEIDGRTYYLSEFDSSHIDTMILEGMCRTLCRIDELLK